MKNKFLLEMQSRGYLNQCTGLDALDEICSKKPISGYIGFDCTASSLHVGSLLQIMILKLMQKHGHKPIILLGGGTTLIGDPSGKDSTRKILEQEEINNNIQSIKKIFNKILNTSNENTKPMFVDNAEWLTKLNYIQFLRDIGSQFTINKMLAFDSVKLRLEREQSLSYMEFNYMILQAYDFYQLFKSNKCILQIGGSDQWGNIINGVELIRKISKKDSFGLTTPLITLSSGAKMGKTESGAIWLDEELLSAYDYWQFWRNTSDNDVERFLKYFTEISIEDVKKISKEENNINNLKILLANEATKILHGDEKANNSEKTAKETFDGKGIGLTLPETFIDKSQLINGLNLIELLHDNKIMNSKSEIRRAIKEKGIKINDKLIENEKKVIELKDFKENDCLKVSHGKKKHFIFRLK